jgi:hypothetical protein
LDNYRSKFRSIGVAGFLKKANRKSPRNYIEAVRWPDVAIFVAV